MGFPVRQHLVKFCPLCGNASFTRAEGFKMPSWYCSTCNRTLEICDAEQRVKAAEEGKLKRCTKCDKRKADVKRQINPYDSDVEGVKHYQNLCEQCVKDLCDDI